MNPTAGLTDAQVQELEAATQKVATDQGAVDAAATAVTADNAAVTAAGTQLTAEQQQLATDQTTLNTANAQTISDTMAIVTLLNSFLTPAQQQAAKLHLARLKR
jgi:hypothetical protein